MDRENAEGKPHIVWEREGHATVLTMRDDTIALRSSVPSPPGSRIEGRLASGGHVRLKVHVVRREEGGAAGSFRLEGRLIDLTRAVRAELEAIAGQVASGAQ
jgi:hypothetical protein